MRRYRITVDGRAYEVEVEEVPAFVRAKAESPAVLQPQAALEKREPPAEPKAESAPLPQGTKILAPMPGKIVSVKAGPGQAVKRGDVLMVLEAMKMENEIQAPIAGTVTAIAVAEGANVNAGALLACIG